MARLCLESDPRRRRASADRIIVRAALVKYPHLSLTDWPFVIVPSERFCTFMADRQRVQDDLSGLIRNLSRREPSSIHLLWAWFGAGKTHSLLYFRHLAEGRDGLMVVFTEFPKSVRTYADVVRPLARALPLEEVANQYLEVATHPHHRSRLQVEPEFSRALRVLVSGKPESSRIAARWLAGELLTAGDLRSIGLARSLRDTDDGIQFVSDLVHLVGDPMVGSPKRVVWIIDEFQRVAALPKASRLEVLAGLHSTFNSCPDRFTSIVSFSGKPAPQLPSWLTPELADRIGLEQTIVLPPLSKSEGLQFLRDVLGHFRPHGYSGHGDLPFQDDALGRVVDWVAKTGELKPRALMQYANAVLEIVDGEIEAGRSCEVSPEFVDRILRERRPLLDSADEE